MKPPPDTSLEQLGDEPDPRFTFANERTFLAWNRTSLALIAAGLVVAQLLKFGIPAARLVISLPLLGLGAYTAFASYRAGRPTSERCGSGTPFPPRASPGGSRSASASSASPQACAVLDFVAN